MTASTFNRAAIASVKSNSRIQILGTGPVFWRARNGAGEFALNLLQ